jgi:hypothetical protein
MSDFVFTAEEIAKVTAKYPGLKESSPGVVEGVLDMHAKFGDEELKDSFHVRITAKNPHSSRVPALYEIGGRVQAVALKHGVADLRDMHRNMDSTSCVCVKQRESEKFPSGSDLLTFIEDLAVPYLYWLSYYDKHGQKPWSDYSHGTLGLIEFYADSTSEQTREDLEEAAQAIRNDAEWKKYSKLIRRPNRGQMCVCGSGRRFESCHPRVLEGAIRLRAELERLNLNPYKLYRR